MVIQAEEATSDFEQLGPVLYQEAKCMDNEMCFIAVHENSKEKFVVFEVYGFETGRVHRIQYNFMNFDAFFR